MLHQRDRAREEREAREKLESDLFQTYRATEVCTQELAEATAHADELRNLLVELQAELGGNYQSQASQEQQAGKLKAQLAECRKSR